MEEGLQRQRDTGKTSVRKNLTSWLWVLGPWRAQPGVSTACRAVGCEGWKAGKGVTLQSLNCPPTPVPKGASTHL